MNENACENCLYFDYDDETDEEICTLDLDEDELERLQTAQYRTCPYYRDYDEYKRVRKQN